MEITPELLKKLRLDLYLSQAEMAARLGVTVQAYQRWEAGKSTPTISNRRKIVALLKEVYGDKVG